MQLCVKDDCGNSLPFAELEGRLAALKMKAKAELVDASQLIFVRLLLDGCMLDLP
jgi:hypothetical protein